MCCYLLAKLGETFVLRCFGFHLPSVVCMRLRGSDVLTITHSSPKVSAPNPLPPSRAAAWFFWDTPSRHEDSHDTTMTISTIAH